MLLKLRFRKVLSLLRKPLSRYSQLQEQIQNQIKKSTTNFFFIILKKRNYKFWYYARPDVKDIKILLLLNAKKLILSNTPWFSSEVITSTNKNKNARLSCFEIPLQVYRPNQCFLSTPYFYATRQAGKFSTTFMSISIKLNN